MSEIENELTKQTQALQIMIRQIRDGMIVDREPMFVAIKDGMPFPADWYRAWRRRTIREALRKV